MLGPVPESAPGRGLLTSPVLSFFTTHGHSLPQTTWLPVSPRALHPRSTHCQIPISLLPSISSLRCHFLSDPRAVSVLWAKGHRSSNSSSCLHLDSFTQPKGEDELFLFPQLSYLRLISSHHFTPLISFVDLRW